MEDLVSQPHAFWRGRRVLITGHTGFKGAWLWLVLHKFGAELSGLALEPDTDPSLFVLAGIGRERGSRFVDLRDARAVGAAVDAAAPEVVIHMAAQALVRPSYASPVETYATNVMGTIHLLEAVRVVSSVRAVVIVTSDKCYQNRGWSWAYREDEALGGYDPYSSSKACAEIVAASWRNSFFSEKGAAIATGRAGNVIGGGDWASERLIPDCARAFLANKNVELRRPKATRPWQYVLEPLFGYLLLAERLIRTPKDVAEAWNFGPYDTDTETVEQVVAMFAKHWGASARWSPAPGDHPHEATALRIDAAKARERLHWQPRLDLTAALSWTADWYRRSAAGESADALCNEQIDRYLSLAAGSR